MTRELSAFEQNLVNAMTEHAHDVDPPRFDAPLIAAAERRRTRRLAGLAAASLTAAAGIAACVAASPSGSGRTTPPIVAASGTATASGPPATAASPSSSTGPATGPASGSATVSPTSSPAGGPNSGATNAPVWPTAPTSSPFRGTVPPVPVLTSIRAAGHPEGGYDRISFEFTGPLPGYEASYVPQVIRSGSGAAVQVPGTAYLQLVFRSAQAHDANGVSTLGAGATGVVTVGQPALRAYVVTGDFEGTIDVALGLSARDGFQVGILTKSATDHVIYVDIARQG